MYFAIEFSKYELGGSDLGKGISIFIGLDKSLKENLGYIKKAYKYGFERIFTSLHIPEAEYEKVIYEFNEITSLADKLKMKIIADISPRTFQYLNADINDLKHISNLNIYGIRVDFGFSPSEIARFTKNPYGLKVEINASTVTERFLKEFEKNNPNYEMIQACHNYYPRLNTGISEEILLKKNDLLMKYNIEIGAFIPLQIEKRGPIYEGLPTLEMHRFMNPSTCAKHLFALGIDDIFFGDSMADDFELRSVGQLDEKIIEFNIELMTKNKIEKKIIFSEYHQNRLDSACDVVRSALSRDKLDKDDEILPKNNIKRKKGFITVDNKDYLRYCGELQICMKDLPCDKKVNVAGKIVDEEMFLLQYIKEGTKFRFKNHCKNKL